MIEHTARLPHGYTATFRWHDRQTPTAVEWTPGVPRILSNRARRKFWQAYAAARRAFMTDVAAVLGGVVVIADVTGEVELIPVPVKH
jgi:hypothetical protein